LQRPPVPVGAQRQSAERAGPGDPAGLLLQQPVQLAGLLRGADRARGPPPDGLRRAAAGQSRLLRPPRLLVADQFPGTAWAQPASMSALRSSARATSSSSTLASLGNRLAISGGRATSGTAGRTKPSANRRWPMSLSAKLS